MTKITTDFVGTESTVVTKSRLTEILAYWGASTAGYTTWGQARADLNVRLLNTTAGVIGNEELAGSFLPKINFLNDPDDMVLDALFGAGEQGVWFDPSDVANVAWRRNLFLYSEQFDNPIWTSLLAGTGTNPVRTADAGVAPDGTSTADRLQLALNGGTTSSDAVRIRQTATPPALPVTFSVWLKSHDDVSTYTMGIQGVGSQTITVTGQWQRFVFSFTASGSPTGLDIFIRGSQSPAHSDSVDVLAWGAQLELGTVATEYQPITNLNTEVIERFPNATMYQDAAGTIPVYAPGQPVGLRLDKSKGLVLGSELVTNGDFAVGTGWALGTGWAISGGTANLTSGAGTYLSQSIGMTVGKMYRVTFTISNRVSGGAAMLSAFWDTAILATTANGTYTYNLRALNSTLYIYGDGTFSIDNISVKEVPGNHATQSTAASRPLYGIEPASGRRNLLTYSEDLTNAFWLKTNTTVAANTTTAPDGTLTADTATFTATGQCRIQATFTIAAGTTYSFSAYFKDSNTNLIGLGVRVDGTYDRAIFNLSTETIDTSLIGTRVSSPTLTSVGGGWFRCSVQVTVPVLGSTNQFFFTGGNGFTGVPGDSYTVWGAQLETGSTVTPYQKVVSAYEVTEAGVPTRHYCVYDGTNDGMLTNSINFTATDKMSVFTAVTKTSDSTGVIAELSATIDSNNGSFALSSSTAVYNITNKGTTARSATSPTIYVAPTSGVLTGFGDISGDLVTLLVNGTQVAQSTADQGTGNYGNYPIYIGRRSDGTLPFNGKDYGIIITGKLATSAQAGNAQNFLLNKLGPLAPVITGVPTIGVN